MMSLTNRTVLSAFLLCSAVSIAIVAQPDDRHARLESREHKCNPEAVARSEARHAEGCSQGKCVEPQWEQEAGG